VSILYKIEDVPDAGQTASRFALDRGPGGITAASKAANVAAIYSSLLAQLHANARPLAPAFKSVALKLVHPTEEGYALVERTTVNAPQTHANHTPGKYTKLATSGGALVDSLLLGTGEGYERARDDQCFAAMRDLAENLGASGEVCRQLSITVALAVLARAGIVLRPDQLP